MLKPSDLKKAKIDAKKQLEVEAYERQVELEVKRLVARKGKLLPKKIVFQWPIRFEHWHK
jgi:hypothetical protein